ncbi:MULTISPECIES: hypothetical protein [Bacillus]|uniref:hypothetical protein n=1 Tax=Bacillus TaxID=1386 RepID=UPI0003687AD3|nr:MULTISPECIES: hypothetical protein [Bacillus]
MYILQGQELIAAYQGLATVDTEKITDITIADEPTGNLDKEIEENIMSILLSLVHDKKKYVIVATHSKEGYGVK